MALGEDWHYYYKYYDGYQWNPSEQDWSAKGGDFSSAPSVVSWGENRTSFPMYSNTLNSSCRTPPVVLLVKLMSMLTSGLDIYGVTSDHQLGHQTWYGTGWYPDFAAWETLGGNLTYH